MQGRQEETYYGDAVEPIAIIGMACRFPGDVSSAEQFWGMIADGRSGHIKVPSTRFDAETWYHPDHDRKGAIQPKSGFFLKEDVSLFDAPFFSITAKEAMGMDPMQRQLLEVSYECFENAGIPIETLSGTMTSVYAGVMTNDYELLSASDIYNLPQNAASGTSRAMLSNRISWFFNLQGPSLTLDTACSSSLYALHLACQSIRLRESQQSLITGVNLILHPNFISQLSSMHMLSPDGISHSFDDRANGYGRGEAVGAILVKPLSRALADGDTIRAVIRGSGANQDGKTTGITMPSGEAQASLIRATYENAGLSMADTSYFEAHGTGTKIGDPTELAAIGASFGPHRPKEDPLYVGSVKTNVGHTEGMAGLAGVIKSVLSLENAVLPGLVGFERLNPKLLLDSWKIALPLNTMPWPSKGLRRASVNSFGFGGSNAHIILDDAHHYLQSRGLQGRHVTVANSPANAKGLSICPEDALDSSKTSDKEHKLLVFSMKDQNGLERLSKSMAQYLSPDASTGLHQQVDLDSLAYTLGSRRSQFGFRSYTVCRSIDEFATDTAKKITSTKQKRLGRAENVVFVFTGQGAQWPLMGRELLSDPAFRASVEQSQQHLDDLGCTWSATELLMDPGSRINQPEYCQPICTVLQVALVQMLEHWGITPRATVGHSSGEIAAAYAAGGITHKDAIKIAYMRGYYCAQIQSRLKDKRGTMMAVGLTPDEAQKYVDQVAEGTVVVGCINSPTSVTLSGDIGALAYLEERIKWDGKFARKLRVDVAYHSPHMDTVSEDFLESMGTIQTAEKFKVPMISSVTAEELDSPGKLAASYWVANMVSAVRFSDAVNKLLAHSTSNGKNKRKTPVNWSAALEIGPHEALRGPFTQCVAARDGKRSSNMIPYTSLVRRGDPADKSAKEAAGLLWSLGHSIDLARVNGLNEHNDKKLKALTCLPPYPWQHSKGFWHEPTGSSSTRLSARPRTDLLGVPVEHQNPHEPRWKNHLRLSENPWMRDHMITGTVLYPAAGMLIMAVEAALQMARDHGKPLRGIEIVDIHFERGLIIPDGDDAVETSLSVRPHETLESFYHWTVYSVPPGGSWTKHSFGLFALLHDEDSGDGDNADHESQAIKSQWETDAKTFTEIKERAGKSIDSSKFYSQLETIGMGYGPTFTNVTLAKAIEGENTGYGTVVIPDTVATMPAGYEFPHVIHPATLDAIFHLIFVALFEGNPMKEAAIPVTVEKVFIAIEQPSGAGAEFVGYSTARKISDRDAVGNIVVSDRDWSGAKVQVTNMVVRKVSSSSGAAAASGSAINRVPKRIGQLQWKEDVELLGRDAAERLIAREAERYRSSGLSPPASQAAVWMERACHKRADLNVLAVVDSSWSGDIIAEILSRFGPVAGREVTFDKATVVSSGEDLLASMKKKQSLREISAQYKLVELENEEGEKEQQGSSLYDIVLVGKVDKQTTAYLAKCVSPDCVMVSFGMGNNVPISDAPLADDGPQLKFDKVLARIVDNDCQTLIATQTTKSKPLDLPVVYLLERPFLSPEGQALKQNLAKVFKKSGVSLESKLLSDAKSLSGQVCISFLEIEDALVIDWTAEEFSQFRGLVFSQPYVLWLTRGGLLDHHEASLRFAPTTGLLRTLRVEIPQITLPHVDLSPETSLEDSAVAQLVFNAFNATIRSDPANGLKNEMELVESGGSFYIPRVVGDSSFDKELNAASDNPVAIPALLSNHSHRVLELVSRGSSAELADAHWVDDREAAQPLSDDEVEVKTAYVAVTTADLAAAAAAGTIRSLGQAASGTVVRVGPNVRSLMPGDEVFFPFLGGGALKTHLRQREALVSVAQGRFQLHEAASVPTAFLAAYYSLNDVARLSGGETALIQLSGSGQRDAAIQIGQALGAEVFVVASSSSEGSLLAERFKIAKEHILDGADGNLGGNLRNAAKEQGFDVVLSDHTGASRWHVSQHVAEFGRYVDISGQVHCSDISMALFERNVSFATVDIRRLGYERLKQLVQKTTALLQAGSIAFEVPRAEVFPVSSLEKAWEHMAINKGATAVVSFEVDATIPIFPPSNAQVGLDPHATYIIAGGLGALGLTIAENLVRHGARHLVLLSRSGVTNPRQRTGVEQLQQRDCVVDTPLCDVTDEKQLAAVMEVSRQKGWKIKGLIQCAMVLRDSIFENMTFERWQETTQPKIKGTWNLHQQLPPDLDFFVVLSSMSGIIGNAAQANYCAGNAYEDAVAHYRHRHGLCATTLNVGLVSDASHFTADWTIEDYLKRYGHWASALVTDQEMQVTLAAVMRGRTTDGSDAPIQLLVGIGTDVPRTDDGLVPWSGDRKFDHRVRRQAVVADQKGAGRGSTPADEIKSAESASDVVAAVERALRAHVAAAMTASPDEIDAEKPLHSFGIDSLKAIQVRNWVFSELKCEVSVFDILSPMPLSQLASSMAKKSSLVSPEMVAKIEQEGL